MTTFGVNISITDMDTHQLIIAANYTTAAEDILRFLQGLAPNDAPKFADKHHLKLVPEREL